jgi:SAM-dependent methyltransferase
MGKKEECFSQTRWSGIPSGIESMVSFWDLAYVFGAPWDTGEPPSELTGLVKQGKLKPCSVLDIGCGTGTTVVYLASLGFEVFGLDISRVAVRKAKGTALRHAVSCRFFRLDFTNTSALTSAGLHTFDVLIDNGCYHSLSPIDRDKYEGSLLHVSHRGTVYLLWCFLRDSGSNFGPPGVDRGEIDDRFSKNFQVLEERELKTSWRNMLFFQMQRINKQ